MEKSRKDLRPWQGIVFFLLIMISFFAVCVPMQMAWGIYGLALTELLILALALLFPLAVRRPAKAVFPVMRPHGIPILGTLILWGSTFLGTMVVSLIQYRLFPEAMEQVSSGLGSVMVSAPPAVSILIVCVMPAVCEEAVHRGVILSCMRSMKRKWMIVTVMGILFGLFHTDPLRFLPTAFLGASISYIVLETGNLFYGALFHCVNNLLPLLMQYALLGSGEASDAAQLLQQNGGNMQVPLASIGLYMILAAAVPFGLYLGAYLIHCIPRTVRPFIPRGEGVRTGMKILIPTLCIFGAGVILLAAGIFFDPVFRELMDTAMQGYL